MNPNNLVAACKREIIEIYKCALEAIKPDRLVQKAVNFRDGNLIVRDVLQSNSKPAIYPIQGRRLHIIGGGKCALAMAKGLADLAAKQQRLASAFGEGYLSVPVASQSDYIRDSSLQNSLELLRIQCRFGSENNLPDKNSVEATNSMLNQVAEACNLDKEEGHRSMFIVLISGGGSACLSSPKHIDLAQKTDLIRKLVQNGADIVELNTVRRCFSHVKGGNLTRHIKRCNPEAEVVALIISDVFNDPIEFIASGPTFVGPQNDNELHAAMAKIMSKYGLSIPKITDVNLEASSISGEDDSVINKVIGNNMIALHAAIAKAENLNYQVKLLGNNLTGTTSDIMGKLLTSSNELDHADKLLLICGGEATVKRGAGETWGMGGRTQEMALDYMINKLSSKQLDQDDAKLVDIFLAGSTDGQDGPTDVAGCMASHKEWLFDGCFSLEECLDAKQRHDSYNFWSDHKPSWLLKLGPTGTNVMDLYFLATVCETN